MNTSHHQRLADPPLRVNMKRHITNYDSGILPYKHKFTILVDECRFDRVWHPGAVSGMGGRRIAIGAVSLPGLQGTCSYGTIPKRRHQQNKVINQLSTPFRKLQCWETAGEQVESRVAAGSSPYLNSVVVGALISVFDAAQRRPAIGRQHPAMGPHLPRGLT